LPTRAHDQEEVRAHRLERRFDAHPCVFSDRDHGDARAHTDHDAKCCQRRSHLVANEGALGDCDRAHAAAFISVCNSSETTLPSRIMMTRRSTSRADRHHALIDITR
jgi:hypothetical protein